MLCILEESYLLMLQVKVTAYTDRTFTFVAKMPSSSFFLLRAAGIEKGSSLPGLEVAAKLSVKHIYEIAKVLFLILAVVPCH